MQMCYISFLDYFVFTANCAFGKKVKHHMYFTDVSELLEGQAVAQP